MQERDESAFRVYYEYTDAGGVVQHAAYVCFWERARTEKLRRLGWEQRALATKEGLLFAVRRLSVEYLCPPFPLKLAHHPAFLVRKFYAATKKLSPPKCLLFVFDKALCGR